MSAPAAAERAELVALAERAARAAGELVHRGRPERLEVLATKSSPTDVVTAMDTASEALLTELLLGERPQDGLLGEEGGAAGGTSGVTWVVDPIDGTVNYLYGLPSYAVSVAAVVGGGAPGDRPDPTTWTVVAGCVHEPVSGRTWTASLGGGARLDGEPLRGPAEVPLGEALVGTGFGYTPQRRAAQARVLSGVLPHVRDIRRAGVASIDLCAVGTGWLDAYYERGLQPWDHAAGALVAAEAGAVVRGLAPHEQASDRFCLAAAPGLAATLGDLVAGLDPLREDAV
ncbi:inositol monophosphatase family protein [uncultured Pseudokineococcus sp.]|uniref:inositol monophosphatase family protein n=1 Tax=uncultured Pseudokineococcus sp. TaxID=1642928 RepID=UPI002607D8AD|nr:inositol monophosphatase family protein [uncultured Pseudokineococcus sp.]